MPDGTESPTGETRAADALTVGWMLSAFAAIAAEVVALLAWVLIYLGGGPEQFAPELLLMARVALFIALVTSLLCILLIAPVYRLRRRPPPRQITWLAVLIGLAPWLALIAVAAWVKFR